MTNISPALRKEETHSQVVFIVVFAGNCAGNRGLSSAGHAIQLEDAPFITLISPCRYLLKHVDPGVVEAKRVVPLIVRVKVCLGSTW
jgi:hypothetical protein